MEACKGMFYQPPKQQTPATQLYSPLTAFPCLFTSASCFV